MSPDNKMMNSILRRAGGAAVADNTSTPSGSRDFTVQDPGTNAPDNQFVYEPLDTTPGAWAVYPPGVPCDANKTRISRADPADVADFPKMQQAIDDQGGDTGSSSGLDSLTSDTGSGSASDAGASSYGG